SDLAAFARVFLALVFAGFMACECVAMVVSVWRRVINKPAQPVGRGRAPIAAPLRGPLAGALGRGPGANSPAISRLWADCRLKHARPLTPPAQSTCGGLLKRR